MAEIRVARNAGFCFGVKRAVDAVFAVIDKYDNIYTMGELIHNKNVISLLSEKGVQIAEHVCDIPVLPSTLVVVRSHGLARSVFEELKTAGFKILDLTCPFVGRIQQKVRDTTRSHIVIVGKADHPEVAGIRGWAAADVHVVNSAYEAEELPPLKSVLVVAQTTITKKLWDEVTTVLRRKCPDIEIFKSICDTTEKRQREAEELSAGSDVVLVIGGKNSSNTEKLYTLCKNNCAQTFYIENIDELPLENIHSDDIISIVAGASTPDGLIREVQTRMTELEKQGTQQDMENVTSDVAPETVPFKTENVADESQFAAEETEAAPQEEQKTQIVSEEKTPEAVEIQAASIQREPPETAAEDQTPAEKSEEHTAAEENDFLSQLEKTFVYIKKGQIVSGSVVQITDNEICVNIGYKSDGIIKKENLTARGDANPLDLFKLGDDIEAEVVSLNDGEGNVVLSRKSIESKLKWKELTETLDNEKIYTIAVERVVKGGVLTRLEGYDAFVPASQLSLKYVEDLNDFVGQRLDVVVIEADKRQRRFVLSHKAVLQKQADEQEKEIYGSFHKGDRVAGKVKRLTDFGAFVDIGGVDGLLHVTDISWTKVKHPSDVLKNGQELDVLVLNADPEKKKISLGLKQLLPKPWDLAPEKYLVGSEVEGTVVRILPFGAFVSLEPTIDGLVHISQITNRRLEKVEEVLRVGDVVRARVMAVDPAKKRITLSIRALLPEPEKPEPKQASDEDGHYVIPPVEDATSSLADFFPKIDE